MPDHTKKVILVTPESKFVCCAEGIMNRRDQGRKLVLEISKVSTDYDSNVIYHHRNALPTVEGSDNVSNSDLDMVYKPNIGIIQWTKYLYSMIHWI